MNPEIIAHHVLLKYSKNISDDALLKVLGRVELTTAMLENTSVYKQVAKDLAAHQSSMASKMDPLLADIEKDHPNLDAHAMIWIIGLRFIRNLNDFEAMCIQISLFLASQRANFYRVSDDKLRLLLTYMHLRVGGALTEEYLDSNVND